MELAHLFFGQLLPGGLFAGALVYAVLAARKGFKIARLRYQRAKSGDC